MDEHNSLGLISDRVDLYDIIDLFYDKNQFPSHLKIS